MVHKRPHGSARRELGRAAHVVRVEVRDEDEIYSLDPRLFGRADNAACVAAVRIRPACIHQKRAAPGRHEHRRLAAFDVDEIDPQCSRRPRGAASQPRPPAARNEQHQHSHGKPEDALATFQTRLPRKRTPCSFIVAERFALGQEVSGPHRNIGGAPTRSVARSIV